MTKAEFDAAVDQLLVQFQGSLTSGRRTVAHNKAVGGVDGSAHTWGLGADMVLDAPNPVGFEGVAADLGLKIIWEATHIHVQPLIWINRRPPEAPRASSLPLFRAGA